MPLAENMEDTEGVLNRFVKPMFSTISDCYSATGGPRLSQPIIGIEYKFVINRHDKVDRPSFAT